MDTRAGGGILDTTTTSSDPLFAAWGRDLAGWGIPPEILAAAPESPWAFPSRVFAERAERQVTQRAGPSYRRAEEALPPGGSVLDVGSGAGAASLPLAPKASLITAVDPDSGMLAAFTDLASRISDARARLETVAGRWPDVADDVPAADLVLCHHVFYNVVDLRPFVEALTAHARARVVVEMTERHPIEPMNPLWLRFHGLTRPAGPSAEDAAEAVSSLGVDVGVERWDAPPLHTYESFDEMVAYHRRRLCLPADADPEVAAALVAVGVDPGHPVGLGSGRPIVTLWWEPPGGGERGR